MMLRYCIVFYLNEESVSYFDQLIYQEKREIRGSYFILIHKKIDLS